VERPAPELSLLVPLFNEEENLADLLKAISAAAAPLGKPYEVVLVDDGSTDATPRLLREAARRDPHLRAVLLRRNFGQTAALAAAVAHARGPILVPLDGDLQNDPADIPRMLSKLEEGYDVVSGWRVHRKDPYLTRILPSRLANRLISVISGVPLHDYGCTLKAYRREVLEPADLVGEMHRFIPVLASWRGARVAEVPVAHNPRLRGQSKYGLGRTFKVVLDLTTVKFLGTFLTKPIYLFGGAGMVVGILGVLCAAWTLYEKFFHGIYVKDQPLFLVSIFLSLVGLQLVVSGLLGEVLSRVYFAASHTPPYVVREVVEAPQCAESPASP